MSKTSSKAKDKYNAKAYDNFTLRLPKGEKAELQNYVAKRGESLNGFIKRAIKHELERDKAEQGNA